MKIYKNIHGETCHQNDKGLLHREDGPAIHTEAGYKAWYINGKRHRIAGPAVIKTNGTLFFYKKNNMHRLNAPAAIYANGDKEFWEFGLRVK